MSQNTYGFYFLSIASLVLGLIGLYYKRHELSLATAAPPLAEQATPAQKQEAKHTLFSMDQLKPVLLANYSIGMSDNKLVQTVTNAATLTGLAAGFGWMSKKVVKEPMTSDPSSNLMNFAIFTAVLAASIATKRYLKDQKIIPKPS